MENKIREGIINGESVAVISKKIGISRQAIYKTIKKNRWIDLIKQKKGKTSLPATSKSPLTTWSENIFPEIKIMSQKYNKILSLNFVYIDCEIIESILLDLMIHTDQKDIKNKTSYFRKYAPLKISNLKNELLFRITDPLSNEDGEEVFGSNVNPEMLLFLREDCIL